MQKSQSVWAVFEQSPVALAGVPQCSSAKVKYICCLPRPNTPAIIRASAAPRVTKVLGRVTIIVYGCVVRPEVGFEN
jgi:hypothetical protein